MTHCDFSIFSPSISHATLPEVFPESDSSSASRKRISAMDGSDEQDQSPGLSQRNQVTLPCSSVTLYIFRHSPPSSSALSARSVQSPSRCPALRSIPKMHFWFPAVL